MLLADREGTPLGVMVTSASPHEVKLIEPLLEHTQHDLPVQTRLLYDKAADSTPLRERLKARGLRLIAPFIRRRHQRPRRLPKGDQRLYAHRWKIERTFGWLKHFRRLTTRWEYHPELHLGFWQLACLFTILRRL